MSLSLAVVRAGLWNFLEQFLKRGVTAGFSLILSYFLAPEDFGLISMLSLFLALAAGLMDSGLREALIRRRRLTDRLLNTAMWAAMGMGGLAYLALFLCAPLVADWYAEPRLEMLIRVVGLVVIVNAFQIGPAARLANSLDFKAFIKATLPAAFASCTLAIALAFAGAGVWALIAQMLLASVISTCLIWREAGWIPKFNLDLKPLLSLYKFGFKLFLSSLIAITVRNSAPALIGKFLGPMLAGYYYFVDKIMEVVMGQLVYSVQNVTYPAFSKISTNDAQLKEAYRKVVEVSVFVVSPCLAIAAGMADALFALAFPEKWQGAVPCFRWLCVVYVMYPLHAINLNILKVKGRSDLFLKLEVIKAVIALSLLVVSVQYGLIALLAGQLAGSVLCYIPNSYYSKKMIGYSVFEQVTDVLPYFLVAALSGLVAWLVSNVVSEVSLVLAILLSGLSGAVVFLGMGLCCRLRALRLLSEVLVAAKGRV